ncbi:PaaI family thioesterase, partial [Pseudomonas aeruginosa]
REDRLNAWIATERAARARLRASRTLELAQVAALSPQVFFDRIGSGQLPCPPYGELVDFDPIEWSEGRFLFLGTPDRRQFNPLGSVHGGYAA